MEKKIFAASMVFAAVVLGMTVVSCDADCSYYEDLKELQQKEEKTPVTPTDTVPEKDDEWETVMDMWYNMANDYKNVDSHMKTNKSEYVVNAPFSVSFGGYIYFITEEANKSSYISLGSIYNTNYGEWYANEEGDSIRTKTTEQKCEFNLYERTLTVVNADAYRLINGQRESFEMPVVVSSFAGHSSDVQQIERNDSIFDRETIKDSVQISFAGRADIAPIFVSAITVIDHFVKIKEPEVENMPEPSIKVDEEIVSISDRTASPVYANNITTWFEVSLVKTTAKVYVVVNGQLKDIWNNTELADVNWCNSAMYDLATGKWIPCNIQMDGSGWTYTFQMSDGTLGNTGSYQSSAVITGLKSFVNENNAKQTPFLSYGSVKRTFSDGDFYTVNGNYPYTVAHK